MIGNKGVTHMESDADSMDAGGAAMTNSSSTSLSASKRVNKVLDKLGLNSKKFFEESENVDLNEVRDQLELGSDKDKLVGMKRILAVHTQKKKKTTQIPHKNTNNNNNNTLFF